MDSTLQELSFLFGLQIHGWHFCGIHVVVFLTGALSNAKALIFNSYAKTAFSIAAIKQNEFVSGNLALGLEAYNEMMFYVLDLKM